MLSNWGLLEQLICGNVVLTNEDANKEETDFRRVHVRLKITPVDACIKIIDDDSIVRRVLEYIGE